MKTYMNISLFLFFTFIIKAFDCNDDLNEKYQPLGTAVLTADNLLMVKYPQGPPENYSGDDFKNLLKSDYLSMYQRLQPYRVTIQKSGEKFKVSVFDGNTLVLTDWSCTEGRIDCWSYNKQCLADTMKIKCDEERELPIN
jgi:hypothetical protein